MRLILIILLLGPLVQATPLAQALYPKTAPPQALKVLVIEYDRQGSPLSRYVIGDPASTEWWPASTVKLFAAIAALEFAEVNGWSHRVQLQFDRPNRKPYTRRLDWLITQAITHSSNLAYDRLVQFAGHDRVHTDLLGPTRGLYDTALQVPYSQNVGSLLDSPRIQMRQGKRTATLAPRQGAGTARCAQSTCTSLNTLAEAMRRVMFNTHLPPGEQLRISSKALKHLQHALKGKRARGREVVKALQRALPGSHIFHKPGYYPDWRSDVLFVQSAERRWVIVLANDGGRKSLNDIARRLGRWLARPPQRAQQVPVR